ncbi:MAG: hypothetical protein ACTHJV_08170 [Rhizobiaceae bacterium]
MKRGVSPCESSEFRSPDFQRLKAVMKAHRLFDLRNIYEPGEATRYGFAYHCIGRGTSSRQEDARQRTIRMST